MNKVTEGFVVQEYAEITHPVLGNIVACVKQRFVASDMVNWEDEDGNLVSCPKKYEYMPFDMVQPENKKG